MHPARNVQRFVGERTIVVPMNIYTGFFMFMHGNNDAKYIRKSVVEIPANNKVTDVQHGRFHYTPCDDDRQDNYFATVVQLNYKLYG